MALRINATTRPQFAAAGQFPRWSVVSKVNNLRPELPACRYNAAYIRRRSIVDLVHTTPIFSLRRRICSYTRRSVGRQLVTDALISLVSSSFDVH